MLRQLHHGLGGNVVGRKRWDVVDQHGQRRAIGHRPVKSQQVRRMHLPSIEMRGAHESDVVSEFSRVLSQPQRLNRRLDSRPRNQNFAGRSRLPRGFEHITALRIREHDGLARRAEHNYARHRRARVALDIVFQLLEIHVAVRIEGRRDRRKDSGKQHERF